MTSISVDSEIKRNQLLTRAISAASMLLSATRAAANRTPAWATSIDRATSDATCLAKEVLPHGYPDDASDLWYASDPDEAGLVEIWQWNSQAAIQAGCMPISSVAAGIPQNAAAALIAAHNAAITLSRLAA
ncbi:conserved hypothetical protein [Hyphomicrobiales bacterium]|jgi:hypothetical protein|nr:conserved hypothetical protein [Hyphomicrobiales bacterium]CAH1702965.1 hypothetical protein BOSEA1005_30837 [Hyphomicrobiales bacterium]CAI0347151.1 conserved hypothetical protein [Hyphomicrobiales bacterium]